MIPTSLKIALAIGIISGGITSLILAELRDGDVVYVEGPSLTIFTDETDYKKGQLVSITVINSGSEPIFFSDSSLGLEVRGLAGELFYSDSGGDPFVLDPGTEHQIFWDQRKTDGSDVFDGIYRISVAGSDGTGNKIKSEHTINIIELDLTLGS